jgi:exodeoxyribonuclease VII small subunit
MKNFEERLERLEELGGKIRQSDVSLDDAMKAFEEGIKLARTMEKELEKAESRIEILMNEPIPAANTKTDAKSDTKSGEKPELSLFEM